MSASTLLRLLVALAVFGGIAFYLNRPDAAPGRVGGLASGDVLFTDLDVNRVHTLAISGRDGEVHVRRGENGWTVDELHGYPANFSIIAQFLRTLNDLKVGQVLRDGEASLEELALNADSDSSDRLVVTLSREGGDPVRLALGVVKQTRAGAAGMPQGRFVRVNEGPVVLVDEQFMEINPFAREWVDRDLMQLPPELVDSISVQRAGSAYTIRRTDDGSYGLEPMGDHEAVEQSAAVRLFQALQWLRFDEVYHPELSDEEVGIAAYDSVVFRTSEGLAYELHVGRGDETLISRPLRIKVSDVSPDQIHQQEATRQQQRFEGWRYEIPVMIATALIPPRESLVTLAETPVETGTAADAVSSEFEEIEDFAEEIPEP
ncbi:MAG TPA: DUF4340 domain-containing protein [Kiritimatiellia bacterium]|nr:DUF4340 domain-containing protein [Kiritimatiellia bacterium]HMO99387.1 DUF4340 domain-containing protein [Kiritimatiellia bacterium]HMP96509.1 DUF4340 domain-containing protein [Kiritimatiellia bacterium]